MVRWSYNIRRWMVALMCNNIACCATSVSRLKNVQTFGSLYSRRSRELQTTETEERAIASEAHTGSRRAFPMGYITPAAMGTATVL